MIQGVEIKELETHLDDRGFFRELIRADDAIFREGFGQWSHSHMHAGVVKAWHIHKVQVDWSYVVSGVLKWVMHDLREDSSTFRETQEVVLGDHQPSRILRIPPGVAHGCKVLSGPVDLLYVTSRTYDPGDEGRIAHDDPAIGYDWRALPKIT